MRAAQHGSQLSRGSVAVRHPLSKAREGDPFEPRRYRAISLSRWSRVKMANLIEQLISALAIEGSAPGDDLIKDDSQCPDVGSTIYSVRFAGNLFWRHVRRRSSDLAVTKPLHGFV